MAMIMWFLVHLQLIAAVAAFSLLNRNGNAIGIGVGSTRLHAMRTDNKHGHHSKHHHAAPNRVPLNKRTAIRWVVQGVERCLAEEGSGKGREGKSYSRRVDASLVDALFLMVNANNQKDVLDAEKRIQVLMKNPTREFPKEVNERVIKATAMAGLAPLSVSLLKALLQESGDYDIPSPMAYTAVLNALRRNGRMDRLEETLADLASSCRKITQATGKQVGVDIVAFNTYLASLCDAAVNEVPFSSSTADIDELGEAFNYTTLANSSSTASPSEQYLYKALNLLKGDVARTKFCLESDLDRYSYNSVLMAAAKCTKNDIDDDSFHFTKSVMLSCLRGMKERGIRPDIVTYNARIEAAYGEEEAIRQIDHVLSDHNVEPDRYTINLMLKPFINAERQDELWSILNEFYEKNAGSNSKMVSSAFEAFLNTLVQSGEVGFAREVFQAFFMPAPKQKKHRSLQLTQTIHVLSKEEQQQLHQKDSRQSEGAMRSTSTVKSHLLPQTKHFNIMLGGYGKAYQSALSKLGKSRLLEVHMNGTLEQDGNATATIIPDVSYAYTLLDAMLDMAVPVDQFTLTSLMALPSTSENITALLERIESAMTADFNPAAYRSIISAYGKAGDPLSACWMFEEMARSGRNLRKIENWNVLLGALAKGCTGEDSKLDVFNSVAASARRDSEDDDLILSFMDGKTCLDASILILDTMRNRTVLCECPAPSPNSQTYCLVASALSESGASEPKPKHALKLFRDAMEEGVAADGRFLNAVLRCFGDDIEGALAAWKSDIGPAAAAYEQKSGKRGTNLIAAYNGLMHVCGRAIRPDIATRIAYAMNKANVEPSEVTLNSYLAGKRVALDQNGDGKNLRLQNQYESILQIECTKYSAKDKRRAKDRKIRIILP